MLTLLTMRLQYLTVLFQELKCETSMLICETFVLAGVKFTFELRNNLEVEGIFSTFSLIEL